MKHKRKKKLLHFGNAESGKPLFINQNRRKTHMHVIGASGRGKTYFLEHLIRQDIKNGDGLCLIDPHGTLYQNIVDWCSSRAAYVSWDKLILLDPTAPGGWTFGFNPFNFGIDADVSYSVDSMVEACAQVWGGEDTSSTPLLKRVLRDVFHALAEQNLTLIEAAHLINERDEFKSIRVQLTEDLRDPVIREHWEQWHAMKSHELREKFSSASNRLSEFLAAEVIRTIIGQREWVIDFRKVMDDGGIVLVNLQTRARLSDFNARTLGTLLTNDMFLKAQNRPEGSRPFYLYIDECGRYLNESIQRMLDESRKRGLHLILANQHLSQLKAAGEMVYSAVMTDAQTKVIFGGLNADDTDKIVREVFLDLNLEEPKESLTRKVAVGQESIILKSGGTSRGSSHSTMHAETEAEGYVTGTSSGSTESEGATGYPDGTEGATTMAWGLSEGTSSGESHSTSTTTAESMSESIAEMSGWTESFKTVYEDAPGAVFSLEEQRYKKGAWLKKQPQQMALCVEPDFSIIPFRVADVHQPKITGRLRELFTKSRFEALPFVMESHVSLAQIESRELEIKQQAGIIPSAVQDNFDPFDNE